MKLQHLLLFIVSCAVLILSDLTAGSLIALGLLFQMTLLLYALPLTKKSQVAAFKIFLISIPTFFFWGGVHSFVIIYLKEASWFYFLLAFIITLVLSLIVSLQSVLAFLHLQAPDYSVSFALQKTFNEIKNNKALLFKTTGLIFIFSFIPWLTVDWKLIFSVMATHLYLNWTRLKPALFGRFS